MMSSENTDPINTDPIANQPVQPASSPEPPESNLEMRSELKNPFKATAEDDPKIEIIDHDDSIQENSKRSEQNSNHDETLGRLHPMSLVFDVMSHVRSLIIPAIIAILSAAQGSTGGLVFAAVIFIPTLIHSAIRYFSLRYQIRDNELIVTQGVFFRRIRTVPIGRVQNIDQVQNVLHRMFGVAEVRIETASGTEPEATLRVLSLAKVEKLRDSVSRSQNRARTITPDPSVMSTVKPEHEPVELIWAIPTNLLIRAGLASNKGTLLLGVLFGLYIQFDEQIDGLYDFEKFAKSIGEGATTPMIIFMTIAAFLLLFVFFRLLGISWYILRFHGYQLTRSGDDLRIHCGLLTKVSATVPRKRIQFISIHRNLLMRWMKLASVRIETAGAAGKGKEDATKTVSSRWFIPVLPEHRVGQLIEHLRPGISWDENRFDWQPISPRAATRLSRLAIIGAVIVGATGLAISRPWGWLVGVVALPLFVFLAIKRSNSKKYARNKDVVVYRSGIFKHKTSMTFYEKIQTVRIDQSPFDRRWNMATLCVDTAASGPADHNIHIAYLTDEFAETEFDAIVRQASNQQPVFN